MNSRQLDRAAYVAAHAILCSPPASPTHAIEDVAEIIKDVFEPFCDAQGALPPTMTAKFLHSRAESAARNDT